MNKIPEAVVEAVARAVCVACEENPDRRGDARGNKYRWQDYRDVALAAISALPPRSRLPNSGRRSRRCGGALEALSAENERLAEALRRAEEHINVLTHEWYSAGQRVLAEIRAALAKESGND